MGTEVKESVHWRPGDLAKHKLAEGLVLEVKEVQGKLVKARVVDPGKTSLWRNSVTTFRTDYLIPES